MESCFKDLRSKKGPKKDHFSSLVLKRTKSLIKDLYASTASLNSVFGNDGDDEKNNDG